MNHPTRTTRLADCMLVHGLGLQRFGLGLVFAWFGAPKLVPGLSPAEDLVAATVTCCDPGWFVPALGAVEVLIGLCFWLRRLMPVGLVLLAGHMCGTALPLFTLPEIVWKAFPVATLEGQYILKNVVLVAAALVLGGATLGRSPRPVGKRDPGAAVVPTERPDVRGARPRPSPRRSARRRASLLATLARVAARRGG